MEDGELEQASSEQTYDDRTEIVLSEFELLILARLDALTDAVNTTGAQVQYMMQAASDSQEQFRAALNGGGIKGLMKLAMGGLSTRGEQS